MAVSIEAMQPSRGGPSMTPPLPDRLTAALTRLTVSVDHLEGAAARRAKVDRAGTDAAFRALQADHARLAAELQGELARGRALLDANSEVSARLDRATATVKAVLAQFEPVEQDGEEPDEVEASAVVEPEPVRRAAGGRGE